MSNGVVSKPKGVRVNGLIEEATHATDALRGPIETATANHDDYVSALDTWERFIRGKQDKAQLWYAIHNLFLRSRIESTEQAKKIAEALGLRDGSYENVKDGGFSKAHEYSTDLDQLFFGKSIKELGAEDVAGMTYKEKDERKDSVNTYLYFGRHLLAKRYAVENECNRLVTHMMGKSDVSLVTAFESEGPAKKSYVPKAPKDNPFIWSFSHQSYLFQLWLMQKLTYRLSESAVGRKFLADQFAYSTNPSVTVFNPYEAFEPLILGSDNKFGAIDLESHPEQAGFTISQSEYDQIFDVTTFDFQKLETRGQLRFVINVVSKLMGQFQPGLLFYEANKSKYFGKNDQFKSQLPSPEGLVDKFTALTWSRFLSDGDVNWSSGNTPFGDLHTDLSALGSGASMQPFLGNTKMYLDAKDVEDLTNKALGSIDSIVSTADVYEDTQLATHFFSGMKLGLIITAYCGLVTKVNYDEDVTPHDVAVYTASFVKTIGGLTMLEDVQEQLEKLANIVDGEGVVDLSRIYRESKLVRIAEVLETIGPVIDVILLVHDIAKAKREYDHHDYDAAAAMSAVVLGTGMMIGADLWASSSSAAIGLLDPVTAVLVVGGALVVGGTYFYYLYKDSKLQQWIKHTYFGSVWSDMTKEDFGDPTASYFDYEHGGTVNYARQFSELRSLFNPVGLKQVALGLKVDRGTRNHEIVSKTGDRFPLVRVSFDNLGSIEANVKDKNALPENWYPSYWKRLTKKRLALCNILQGGVIYLRPIKVYIDGSRDLYNPTMKITMDGRNSQAPYFSDVSPESYHRNLVRKRVDVADAKSKFETTTDTGSISVVQRKDGTTVKRVVDDFTLELRAKKSTGGIPQLPVGLPGPITLQVSGGHDKGKYKEVTGGVTALTSPHSKEVGMWYMEAIYVPPDLAEKSPKLFDRNIDHYPMVSRKRVPIEIDLTDVSYGSQTPSANWYDDAHYYLHRDVKGSPR